MISATDVVDEATLSLLSAEDSAEARMVGSTSRAGTGISVIVVHSIPRRDEFCQCRVQDRCFTNDRVHCRLGKQAV